MQSCPSPGLWKHPTFIVVLTLLSAPLLAQTNAPARKYSSLERMKTSHLQAAHADAVRLQQQRQTLPPLPGLHDYKAILHAHAEDSAHTGGTRPEMLADAKRAGVQVIMLTDHYRPPRDFIQGRWRGLHEGVLFIPGSEMRGFLLYPVSSIMDRMDEPRPEFVASVTASNGLIFLSHLEERLDHPMEGLTGMEIYNRHWDAKKDMAGLIAIAMKLLDPVDLAEIQENLRLYPDELLAAQITYQQDYIDKWDAETQKRRLTGIAANDCHHNMVLVVKMVDEDTVLFGTNVDKDEDMRKATAGSRPGIRELTKGHKPGDILVRADLDPYYRSFRDSTTHILATELTETAIRAALQQGRAFVSHDWMCDATGFSFLLSPPARGIMGDEVKFAQGQKLVARFPVPCHIRLLRDGKLVSDLESDRLEYAVEGPGVFRVEGWLKLDGEERPWIYSNPIYVR
jgi:hypothetical protein